MPHWNSPLIYIAKHLPFLLHLFEKIFKFVNNAQKYSINTLYSYFAKKQAKCKNQTLFHLPKKQTAPTQ